MSGESRKIIGNKSLIACSLGLLVIIALVIGFLNKDKIFTLFSHKNDKGLKYIVCKKNDEDRWGIFDLSNKKFIIENEWKNKPIFAAEDIIKVSNKDNNYEYYKIAEKPIRIGDEYKNAGNFQEGMAAVAKEDNYLNFIDITGKELFKLKELEGKVVESVGEFNDGLARFKNIDGKWGFIDKKGNVKISAKYDNCGDFHEGLAVVTLIEINSTPNAPNGAANAKNKTKSGLIDTSGKEVIKLNSDMIYNDVSEGMIGYSDDERKTYGFLDTKGNKVIKATKNFVNITYFNNGLAGFYDGDKWGVIDKKGNIIVRAKYNVAFPYNGLIWVMDGGKVGYLDYTGKEIIRPQFEDGVPFIGEYTFVKDGNKYVIIDKKGTEAVKISFKYIDYQGPLSKLSTRSDLIESDYFDVNGIANMLVYKISKTEFNDVNNKSTLEDIMKIYNIDPREFTTPSGTIRGQFIQKYSKYANVTPIFQFFKDEPKEPIKETRNNYGFLSEFIIGYKPNLKAKINVVAYEIQLTNEKARKKHDEIINAINTIVSKTGYKGNIDSVNSNATVYTDETGKRLAAVFREYQGIKIALQLND